jgi:glycosyltransferase involved in cell wall biosynthesis
MEYSEMPQKELFRCLSVIVPVYNEAPTIRHIVKRISDVALPKEIIIVDDGSTDGTRDILQSHVKGESPLCPSSPQTTIKIIFQEKNQGKGAAIRAGIAHLTGDLALIQDADLEYDPNEYPRLIEPILSGDADVVYGSRFLGDRRRVQFYWHTVGNRFLTFLSNVCTNLNLTDMETCYKVFKSEILRNIPLRSNRFGFEPEITNKIAKLRLTVYEVQISYRGRSYAEGKKIGWKDGISAIFSIFRFLLFDDLHDRHTSMLRTLRFMEGAGRYNEWLYRQSQPFLGNRILEVGAGVGGITKYLLNKMLVVATDSDNFYFEELQRKYGSYSNFQIIKYDPANDGPCLEYGPFDSILCMNVLEHLTEDKKALHSMSLSLQTGGKLVLLAPAHQLLYSTMDRNLGHFRRYSRLQLKSLLQEAGFEIESIYYLNALGAVGWFVNGLIFRRAMIPSRQVRLFDLLVRFLSLEKVCRPPFGLSVLAVAKKM